jgi:hypothetical protein
MAWSEALSWLSVQGLKKPRKPVKIGGLWAIISTWDLQNTTQDCCSLDSDVQ